MENKKILILGLGREGMSTYKFLRDLFPEKILYLADLNEKISIKTEPNIKLNLGKDYLKNINDFDIIIRTPGIPLLAELEKVKINLSSQTKLFFDLCPAPIIGITGTKGKGTTASLTYHIFKLAGLPAFLAGNIGTPMLSLLKKISDKDIVILELSSHQLEDLGKSPKYAVLLNIFPEHLDHFKNFQEYANSKAKITKFQTSTDWLIYNSDDELVRQIAAKSKAQKIAISLKTVPILKHNPLIGKHNLYNIMAAIKLAKLFKISDENIDKALQTFITLPHRLELAGTFKGITFYNDSQGTNPKATIAALNSFKNISTLICGGYDRGGISYDEVGKRIAEYGVKTLILFPTTGELIWEAVKKYTASLPAHFYVKSMPEAVKLAYENSPKNTVCLLSPSSASFGIFKDYADRGDQFKLQVKLQGN